MELTKKQLDYLLTCLNFHYSEYEGSKDDILELNASICRLIDHEIKQFEKLQKKIDKKRELLPRPEWG